MKKYSVLTLLLLLQISISAQSVPSFGPEIPVTILNLTHDAMEPHISPDGNALFFNSLNDGITTSIYYAAKINDSTFTYLGTFPVVNQSVTPRLDAVASLDVNDNFYWVSNRDYPSEMDNLFHVTFDSVSYSNFGRLRGNIYIYSAGWIIMDAGIDYSGYNLYYCNALFTTCGSLPCFSKINLATKVNDSTFNKAPFSDIIMANINDTLNYINYAPAITSDGLEFYYTRAPIGGSSTEILVSTRTDTLSAFGSPVVIDNSPYVPEGPTLTTDKQILYYHKKIGATYQIYMRRRNPSTGIDEVHKGNKDILQVIPNPASSFILLKASFKQKKDGEVIIFDLTGKEVFRKEILAGQSELSIDISTLQKGMFLVSYCGSVARFVVE